MFKGVVVPCSREAWCPWCIANRKGRSAHKGHRYYKNVTTHKYRDWSSYMKKPSSTEVGSLPSGKMLDEKFSKDYPRITEYLTDAVWEDGTPRMVSTVSVFVEDGAFKLALNDKDLSRSLYITADGLISALRALEVALGKTTADWRSWHKGKGRK